MRLDEIRKVLENYRDLPPVKRLKAEGSVVLIATPTDLMVAAQSIAATGVLQSLAAAVLDMKYLAVSDAPEVSISQKRAEALEHNRDRLQAGVSWAIPLLEELAPKGFPSNIESPELQLFAIRIVGRQDPLAVANAIRDAHDAISHLIAEPPIKGEIRAIGFDRGSEMYLLIAIKPLVSAYVLKKVIDVILGWRHKNAETEKFYAEARKNNAEADLLDELSRRQLDRSVEERDDAINDIRKEYKLPVDSSEGSLTFHQAVASLIRLENDGVSVQVLDQPLDRILPQGALVAESLFRKIAGPSE